VTAHLMTLKLSVNLTYYQQIKGQTPRVSRAIGCKSNMAEILYPYTFSVSMKRMGTQLFEKEFDTASSTYLHQT